MNIRAIEAYGEVQLYCVFASEDADTPLACFKTEAECEEYIQQ
jgi:hypothetical protein